MAIEGDMAIRRAVESNFIRYLGGWGDPVVPIVCGFVNRKAAKKDA
jgi:hypothetical protein